MSALKNIVIDPEDEEERTRELTKFKILNTPPEEAFDHIAQIAAFVADVPIGLVTFADLDRFWFKASNMDIGSQIARDESVCKIVIKSKKEIVINDCLLHPLTFDHPYVISGPKIRFYASFPILSTNNVVLGTISLQHLIPKSLDDAQSETLKKLTKQVLHLLELRVAKEKAQQVSELKTRFLAHMSHEIRTPLTCINGMTGLLQQTSMNREQKEYVDAIYITGIGLLALINDIIDISKMEMGKLVLESVPFNLNETIDSVKKTLTYEVQRRGLDIYTKIDKQYFLIGDPLRLRQIFMNLVNNAIKFTPLGFITISNQVIREDKTSLYMRFNVSDTGIGIKDEAIAKLFKDFQQAEGSYTEQTFGGSGLGLSICRNIIDQMEGKIGVYRNEEEVGSTFYFEVPLLKAEPEQIKQIVGYDSSEDNHEMHVLIAEDNKMLRTILHKQLGKANVLHTLVDDGLQACNAFESDPDKYTVIMLDNQMPVMDGYDAARRIRQSCKSVPIIAFTADAFERNKELCVECGMNDFISKPYNESELLRTLQKWSNKRLDI